VGSRKALVLVEELVVRLPKCRIVKQVPSRDYRDCVAGITGSPSFLPRSPVGGVLEQVGRADWSSTRDLFLRLVAGCTRERIVRMKPSRIGLRVRHPEGDGRELSKQQDAATGIGQLMIVGIGA